MSTFSTRSATESDLAVISDIYTHAVEHSTATFDLEPPDMARFLARAQTKARS